MASAFALSGARIVFGVGKPVSTVTQQRVLVFKGGVFTVEPSLVPLFGVTVHLGMRKFNLFSFLNGDATKFSVGSVYKFSTPVQMKKTRNSSEVGSSCKYTSQKTWKLHILDTELGPMS